MNENKTLSTKLAMTAGTISTPSIRDFTIEMMKVAPPSYRTARASRHRHPPDEREPGGNVLHTTRVVRLVLMMADACRMNRTTRDVLMSAAILHDICRYGLEDESEFSVKGHPGLVRELAKKNSISCRCSERIFSIVEKHMGRWGPYPYTANMVEDDILHIADMISARAEEVWEQLK